MKTPTFTIVIPTYNEKENIGRLLDTLYTLHPKAHVVVVDDSPTQDTAFEVKKRQKIYSTLHLLRRTNGRGRGSACLAGFTYVMTHFPKIDYLVEMDADFSHNPESISTLLTQVSPNTVVIGSRYVQGGRTVNWPLYRIILSRIANTYIRLLLGLPIRDNTNGFRVYPRNLLQMLNFDEIKNPGFIMLSEIAYRLKQKGAAFEEVPIVFLDRTKGKSNATIKEVLLSLVAVFRLKREYSRA